MKSWDNSTLDIYLASAGTGKTTKLLDIIDKHLEEGVPIDRIAFVTFTKKGAEVAQLRTAERFGLPLDKLKNFRTIHSMAFRGCGATREIMMDYAKYKDFGEKAGYNFGTLGLNTQEGIDWNEMKDQQLVAIEQLYRNNRPYCEQIMEDRVDYADLVRYMQLYVKYKKTFGYKDFTDLLEDYIASGRTEDVDIVCLDEMQDSSLLQWQLVFQAFSNAKHVYAAGDIKQCQPGDEVVLCRDIHWKQGLPQHLYYKRLDELNPEVDTLVSMSRKRDGHEWHFTGGYRYQIEHHIHKGNIVCVDTGREVHRYTPEHRCLVRCFLDDSIVGQECVYLMGKGGNYKIGITRMTGASSWRELGPLVRMREETADEMWILKICSHEEALVHEMLYSYKYGIPQAILSRKDSWYEMYDIVYQQINTRARAAALLRALGKDIRYPQFWRSDRIPQKLDTSYERSLNIGGIIQMYAMNLDPRFMDMVQYRKTNRNQKGCGYIPFAVTVEPYEGEVYSLNVESPSHTYINGELATHNCIFTYAGASPDTLLKLRGNQHVLDLSHRVPSRILAFAQNIVDEMTLTDHSCCKSTREGGEIDEIGSIDELTEQFDINKTYFFLARNKKFFKQFEEWCRENAIPYCIKGEPIFTATDKLEFREGRTDAWDAEKLDFARYCYSKGTFYPEPKVNISTIHTVKGDEADVVVLMSDISKAVASQLDVDEDSEHRVFYVAVTRAKEKLIIVQPQTRLYYPYLF